MLKDYNLEPEEPDVMGHCLICDGEIYEGCAYYEYNGWYFDDMTCLTHYLQENHVLVYDRHSDVFTIEDLTFMDVADVWIYLERYKEGEN